MEIYKINGIVDEKESIIFNKATIEDINELIKMRVNYLNEDYGELTDDQVEKIIKSLPDYYVKHLNKDLSVYVARTENIISCCFLLVSEKPANPSFIHGRTGTVLNVYTVPGYRRKGIAGKLVKQLLLDAENMELDFVELKSTDEGYNLYRSLGFVDNNSKYHNMIKRF